MSQRRFSLGLSLFLVLQAGACSSASESEDPTDTSAPDSFAPDTSDTFVPDTSDTSAPDTADTSAPDTADTSVPDTALPPVTTCVADTVTVNVGEVDPGNPCQVCVAVDSGAEWSLLANGAACGAGSFCVEAECSEGCWIGGELLVNGALAPDNSCRHCDAISDSTDYTTRPLGSACGEGRVCDGDACEAGCFINGAYFAAGTLQEGAPCFVCSPSDSTSQWTQRSDGGTCAADSVCSAGACQRGCFLAGAFVAPDAPGPDPECQRCAPDLSTSAWSAVDNGSACGTNEVCADGVCTSGCYIAGGFVAPYDVNAAEPCQICTPVANTLGWSVKADGDGCGTGMVCTGGVCSDGCYIDATFYEPGASNPANPCQDCANTLTTGSFTNRAAYSDCGGGICILNVCVAAPVLSLVSPTCAPNTGGTAITVTGGSFAPGATVSIGGVSLNDQVVKSGSQITGVLPPLPGQVGRVEVSVKNVYGGAAASSTLFGLTVPYVFGQGQLHEGGATVFTGIAAGDVDGDGKADRVSGANMLVVIDRDGQPDGSYAEQSTYTGCVGASGAAPEIAVLRVNDDALDDIVLLCGSDLHLLLGQAGAAPAAATTLPIGATGARLRRANLNGDAFGDLVVALKSTTLLRPLLGNSDGTFTALADVDIQNSINQLAVGDVTGDGLDDLVVGSYTAAVVSTAVNNNAVTFDAPVTSPVSGIQALNVGRIDGDSYSDIIVGSESSAVSASIYFSVGDGTFAGTVRLTSGGLTRVWAHDLNRDGNLDVLVGTGGGLRFFPGNGDGTFSCGLQQVVTGAASTLTFGDADGNGQTDVMTYDVGTTQYSQYMGSVLAD